MSDTVEWTRVRVFGDRIPGTTYAIRPGAYAVIFDWSGCVAVVQTRQGCHLPGGGAAPGEFAEQTLAREVAEECGRAIVIGRRIGEAVQLVFSEAEGGFEKRCVFFEGTFDKGIAAPSESDHRLVWLEPECAIEQLTHTSQSWAVGKSRGIGKCS